MAKKKAKETKKPSEESESEVQEQASGKGKSPILIILIVVLLLVIAGGVYFFVLRDDGEPKEEREEPVVHSYYSPGTYFVTNVEGSARLLKSEIVLVLDTEDEALAEELNEKNAEIRDTIIFLLRELTEEDVRSAGNQEELRKKMIEQLNIQLNIDNIVDVKFSEFVMQ